MPIFLYTADESQRLKLNDYQVDTSTSLQLVGYGYFAPENPTGLILDQNLANLLQNFSSGAAPSNPMSGQIWFNDSTDTLNIFDQEWSGILLEDDVVSSSYINDTFITESTVESYNYATLTFLNDQNYETSNSLEIYVSEAGLANFNYITAVDLNTSIAHILSDFITMSEITNLLMTVTQINSYMYLTITQLNQLGLLTQQDMSGYLTENQPITLSGDFTGSGSTAITAMLSLTGIPAGNYDQVVVDASGRIRSSVAMDESFIAEILGYSPTNPTTELKASSFSTPSGYQVLPSGLIIQWVTGSTDPGDNTSTTQTLPWAMTFPTMFLGALVSTNIESESISAELWYQISNSQTTASSVVVQRHNDSTANITTSSPFIIGFGY